jgi:hypothetical protein
LQVKNDEPNVVFPPFPPAVGEPVPLPPAPPPPPTMRTEIAFTLAGVVYVPEPEVNTWTVCGTVVKPVPPDATGNALVNESVLIVAVPAILAVVPT